MERNSTKNYEIVKQIGEGSYSKVYKAVRLIDQSIVAIKIVNVTKMDKVMINNALNEIRILNSVNNDHVVDYSEAFMDASENNLWIVMEFMGGGDLSCAIKLAKKENRTFPERVIWIYMIQLLKGLASLNQFKIIHRDIKPANIFLTSDQKTVKLGDMNVSKVMVNDLTRTQIGTPSYLSPEIWDAKAYDSKCDIYSLGCCMYEMAALRLPFEAKSIADLKQKIKNTGILPLPSGYSEELKKVIFQCLSKNPSVRPTAEKLISFPLIVLRANEYNLPIEIEWNQNGKLMDTILYNGKLSNLKNILPKKDLSKRSNSMANLRLNNSKNDPIVPNFMKKNNLNVQLKVEIKQPTNVLKAEEDKKKNGEVLSDRQVNQNKINLVRPKSGQASPVQAMSVKKRIQLVEQELKELKDNPQSNRLPKNSPKSKIESKKEEIEVYEKNLAYNSKKVDRGSYSSREVPIKADLSKGKIMPKNLPPSLPTKIGIVKDQAFNSNRKMETPVLLRAGNRNNSASAKKFEPVNEGRQASMKRQNSFSGLSNDANVIKQALKPDHLNGNVIIKVALRVNERPLPPSGNSFKMPPQKSLVGQIRSNVHEIPRQVRLSANHNSSLGRNESRDKIIKFDDFIKHFEESNNRLSKLKDGRGESAFDIREARHASVNKSRG